MIMFYDTLCDTRNAIQFEIRKRTNDRRLEGFKK